MKSARPTNVRARWHRIARDLARVGVAVAAVGLFATVADALPAGTPSAGAISISPVSGNSDTTFSLVFGSPPQSCPGDAINSYRWGTFITPITNDPAPMTYSASGIALGPTFTGNLRDPIGTQVRAQNPGLGDGLIVAPTGLSFASSAFASLAGDYWVGIACTLPDNVGVVQTVKYWSTRITITASAGAGANSFTYGAATSTTTTTTTVAAGTTTTTVPSATTTSTTSPLGATTTSTVVPGGSTTTTVPCGSAATATTTTTTTPAGSTTTTTRPPGATTTTTTAPTTTTTVPCVSTTTTVPSAITSTTVRFSPGGTGGSPSGSALANTGSSTTGIVVWAVLLITFGRMALLLGRKPKVLSAFGA